MKLRALFTTAALGAACLIASPANAQTVTPCEVYMCMAGISGVGLSGGPACTPATTYFFSLQIWDPYYDASATSTLRRGYISSCLGSQVATNATIIEAIIARWGTVP